MPTFSGRGTGVTVKLIGGKQVLAKFRMLPLLVRKQLKDVVHDSALRIQRGGKERCPVRKTKGLGGRLRNSIRVYFYRNGQAAQVGSDVEYSKFVEFGTGMRGSGSSHPPVPTGWVYGPRPGMKAQPFLFPAFEAERPRFIANVVRKVRKVGRGLT